MNKTILITGCSSGIGRMTAKYFQEKGWNVVATVRKFSDSDAELTNLGNVLVTELDVTKEDTIKSTVEQAVTKFGKIDVLLNNAGYGSYGILEATPEQKIRMQFEVNVIGLLLVTKNVIPIMRKQGSGIIINISSMGGKITFPMGTLYHGSKFAVEGMSEALSYELSAIGIQVKMIEPGVINTNFATSSFDLNIDPALTEYQDFTDRVLKAFEAGANGSEPVLVAETIYKAATDGTNQLRYIAGPDAEQIIAARKQMDDPEYLALIRSQYGL
ncbi:SDR family oxidoreductase [Niabella soli]|uniref:Short-chain dehydrogenase n=1 Tax=Niabella soli DSM 19437 TaxID=929713 RepID=W0EWT9_9BACT|nr:SDR family oxidoreductase [Niabella soli]AHF15280.1 short-chain dehydrogenase [Niabella soli DSM 19437]